MKKKEDVRELGDIHDDLLKYAKDMRAIRRRLDDLAGETLNARLYCVMTETSGKLDRVLRDLTDIEKIFVVAAQERMAELLEPGLTKIVKAMQERKRLPGEEIPSERPSDSNKRENA